MARPVALVTGASVGIGKELARLFARDGYDVILVARRADALAEVARELNGVATASVLAADLARPGSAQALADALRSKEIRVDVLVNNAGFGLAGEFAALTLEQQQEMIQLNVVTLTELTRLLLPGMLQRGTGGVLNVASTAAFQPGPLMSVYYATKAFVLSFTEGLAGELEGTPIKVTALCPGPTETEFASRARATATRLFARQAMSAMEVAREGYRGWKAGETIVIPGGANRRGAFVVRLLPRAMVRRVVKRLNSGA